MKVFAKYESTQWFALLFATFLAFEPVSYAQNEGPLILPPLYIQTQAQPAFSQPELDQMLAPIALYPDQLLTQILMAATYPAEVAEAARWSRANPGLRGDDAVTMIQQTYWDPSVKSLVAFPQILQMMDYKLDWTERLGDAFLTQEAQLMDTVQNLRQRAYAAGSFSSNDQILVDQEGTAIVVEPTNPGIVYVPYYDPNVVYGSWWWVDYQPVYWAPWPGYHRRSGFAPGFAWGVGIPIAAEFFFGDFDWHHRRANVVNVNNYYYNGGSRDQMNPARRMNTAPGIWQHDPDHRRGVAYRDESLRQQSGRANASPEARHDFRGYDQSPFNNRGTPGNRRNEGGETATPPGGQFRNVAPEAEHARAPLASPPPHEVPLSNVIPQTGERTNVRSNSQLRGEGGKNSPREFNVNRPDLRSAPGSSPDAHTAETRPVVGGGSAGRPVDTPQARPSMPVAISRPAPESRPHALEGIERGADVQMHSLRGRASFEGAARSPINTPAQRPAGNVPVAPAAKAPAAAAPVAAAPVAAAPTAAAPTANAPAANAPGEERRRPAVTGQPHDNNRDTTGQRKHD